MLSILRGHVNSFYHYIVYFQLKWWKSYCLKQTHFATVLEQLLVLRFSKISIYVQAHLKCAGLLAASITAAFLSFYLSNILLQRCLFNLLAAWSGLNVPSVMMKCLITNFSHRLNYGWYANNAKNALVETFIYFRKVIGPVITAETAGFYLRKHRKAEFWKRQI